MKSPEQRPPRKRFRKKLLIGLFLMSVTNLPWIVINASIYLSHALLSNNFHVVSAERLYRSAEFSPGELGSFIQAHNIRSVIDLRVLGDEKASWASRERAISNEAGAEYRHIGFVSSQLPDSDQVLKLIQAFHELPEPILIHCSSGAERTAVAAAVWRLTQEQASVDEALRELNPRYGFFQVSRDWHREIHNHPVMEDMLLEYQRTGLKNVRPFKKWLKKSNWRERLTDKPENKRSLFARVLSFAADAFSTLIA